jgi:hypothetical protein
LTVPTALPQHDVGWGVDASRSLPQHESCNLPAFMPKSIARAALVTLAFAACIDRLGEERGSSLVDAGSSTVDAPEADAATSPDASPDGGEASCMPGHCGNGTCEPACGESASNCELDCWGGPICGDGTCDPDETSVSCPQDCPAFCGNGVCDSGETPETCSDCGDPPFCGDHICQANEDYLSCPKDCPLPYPSYCGDGICYADEDDVNCPQDCPFPVQIAPPRPFKLSDIGFIPAMIPGSSPRWFAGNGVLPAQNVWSEPGQVFWDYWYFGGDNRNFSRALDRSGRVRGILNIQPGAWNTAATITLDANCSDSHRFKWENSVISWVATQAAMAGKDLSTWNQFYADGSWETRMSAHEWGAYPWGGVFAPNVNLYQTLYISTERNGDVLVRLSLEYYPFPNHDTAVHINNNDTQVHTYATTYTGPSHVSLWLAGTWRRLYTLRIPNGANAPMIQQGWNP